MNSLIPGDSLQREENSTFSPPPCNPQLHSLPVLPFFTLSLRPTPPGFPVLSVSPSYILPPHPPHVPVPRVPLPLLSAAVTFLTECQAAWTRSFSGWDATSNCSEAVFVTCDQDGMLTSMGLLSQSLTGFLPSSMGAATRLSKLDLSANNFSGGLPAAIGKLSLLTYLYARASLPSFPSLPSLPSLPLSLLPSRFQQLYTVIRALLLSRSLSPATTSLTLPPPPHIVPRYYTRTPTSPPSPPTTTTTHSRSVSQNRLAGAIPSTISALSNLEQLSLYNNSFSGSIPPAIYGLKALTVLEVGRNYFTGSFPSQFGALSNLEYLYARENALQGSIPATLGSLSRLTIIQLGGNKLTDSIPASFSNLLNLQGLCVASPPSAPPPSAPPPTAPPLSAPPFKPPPLATPPSCCVVSCLSSQTLLLQKQVHKQHFAFPRAYSPTAPPSFLNFQPFPTFSFPVPPHPFD
ncbi:unnamed protein product [Closterium sp. NIES-65]|nr:unnamed protein product [Closterium sp. NIES-65]